MHKEADILIPQHTIHIAKTYTEPKIFVVCDHTGVIFLFKKIQCSLTMQSPMHGRSCIDIKETALKHAKIIPELLALHAPSGCDTVAATYGIGKTKAVVFVKKTTIHLELLLNCFPWKHFFSTY